MLVCIVLIMTLMNNFFIYFCKKWVSFCIHDGFDCQTHKYKIMKQSKATILSFSNLSSFLTIVFWWILIVVWTLLLNEKLLYCNCGSFWQLLCFETSPKSYPYHAVNFLIHHGISIFGHPQYLITDRQTEYRNCEIAHLCILSKNWQSPRTSHSPRTNGLVEQWNEKCGTHPQMFFRDTPENWSTQVQYFAYALNTQPMSLLHISPYEIFFIRNRLFHWIFLGKNILNVQRNTALTYYLFLITNSLIQTRCFRASCWNHFVLLCLLLLKQHYCSFS